MALEPRRRISDQREARRVAFWKPIFAEAADLLEHALGELWGDALGLHARSQPLAMTLHPSAAVPRRHVAAQLICFSRRVIRHHHRKLQDRKSTRLNSSHEW